MPAFDAPAATSLWPHGDPREVVRSILTDGRFRAPAPPPPQPSWLDILWNWFLAFVHGLLHAFDRVLGSHNSLEATLGLVVIGVGFALLAFGAFVLVRRAARRGPARRPAPYAGDPAAGDVNADALRRAALAAARERRYREAAALLFGSATRALDERGRLTYDPARTAGEYRRLVRDATFDELANAAVIALFAAVEPRADLFERMSGAYDRFFGTPAR